ncbi:hypothetical protein WICPIJ_004739 [Wickerhamomyces pijperi]|uniref:Decapping nuclease n=1 Tax=Wickerhamomyces pijperi TaxID=599730 RepID=A0A9P8Q7J4_WICPI|nr:hypothetical protein WICPIJ_004739 [Wickerhamomyces pijperi]
MSAKTFPLSSRSATTSLKQPKEITSYSRTFDGDFVNDDSCLSYFYLPDSDVDTCIDLGAGFKNFKEVDEDLNSSFKGFLQSIQHHEEVNNSKIKADIITFRGNMTKLLTLPYNSQDPLFFNIVFFDGHFFIAEDKPTTAANSKQPPPTDPVKRMMYSGYKFESIATVPKPLSEVSRATIDKRPKKVVNNIEQYCSVVRTGIGKTKIVLGGEVDCVWDFKPSDKSGNPLDHYVELKTSKTILQAGQAVTFEKKLFRTWAQCFLLGIPRVIYGFRDENLILRSVEEYRVDEIPVMLKTNPVNNNPRKINCTDALKWYGAVVEWIVNQVPKKEDKAYRLSFDPATKHMNLVELLPDVAGSLLRGGIVSDEFKKHRLARREAAAKAASAQ